MRYADKIVLCTHGQFGEKLKESAEMLIGKLNQVEAVSLLPGMTPETLTEKLESILSNCQAVLCLVDIAGGTPFNVSARLTAQYPVILITGVNMPMLIDICENMDEMEYEELAKHAVESLKESGRIVCMKGAVSDE